MTLTGFVAVYAAILSTFVFVWNIRSARATLKVEMSVGVREDGEYGIYITVQNPSGHTAHVNSISLLYPHEALTLLDKLVHMWRFRRIQRFIGWIHASYLFADLETGLPRSIEAKNSFMVFVPAKFIFDMLKDTETHCFRAVVQDALWRDAYSAPLVMLGTSYIARS